MAIAATKTFNLKALITAVDKLSPTLAKINKNVGQWQRQMKGFSKGAIPMGAGFAGMAGIATKAFATAEDAALSLKSAMMLKGGIVPDSYQKLVDLAKQLGTKLPGSTADMEAMMAELVKNGTKPEEILNGVGKATAYLAVKLKMATDQAAIFSAKMKSATGATAEDMMPLLDMMQRLEGVGVEPEKMLSAFSALVPALSALKMQGSAAARALAPLLVINKQMQGETVGIAINKIISLGLNAKKVADVNASLAHAGIKLDFTDQKGGFGGLENMFNQMAKLRKLTDQQFKTIMPKLFGDDSQTLQVLDSIVKTDYSKYMEIQQTLLNMASLQEKVNSELGSTKNIVEASTGNLENMNAAIGEKISPEIKGLLVNLGELAAKIENWINLNPAWIRSLYAVAGAITAIKLAALAATYGLTAVRLLLVTTPIGIAITVLAAGAGLIIANWEKVGPWFEGLWIKIQKDFDFLKEDWQYMLNDLPKRWENTKNAIFAVWNAMARRWQEIRDIFRWDNLERSAIDFLGLGTPGAQGANGTPGAQGANGLPGAQGANGTPGAGFSGLPSNIDKIADLAAQSKGVDPALVKAVIGAESGGDPNATSNKGAMGLMQLMPATAKRFGVSNAYDAQQNASGGASYLAYLLKHYGGNEQLAIAAYNAGEGNVDKYGGVPPFPETQAYTKKVMESLRRQRMSGQLDINIHNAPQGTRVAPKQGENLSLNTKVGYRSLGHALA